MHTIFFLNMGFFPNKNSKKNSKSKIILIEN